MQTGTTDEAPRRWFRRYWTFGVGSGAHVLVAALLDWRASAPRMGHPRRKVPISDLEPRALAAVDLCWWPLGAGGHFVRLNGRIYEAIAARIQRRPRCDLYHSALVGPTRRGAVRDRADAGAGPEREATRRRRRGRQPLAAATSDLPLRDRVLEKGAPPTRGGRLPPAPGGGGGCAPPWQGGT